MAKNFVRQTAEVGNEVTMCYVQTEQRRMNNQWLGANVQWHLHDKTGSRRSASLVGFQK
jgi:hypothetical protein